MRKKTELTFFDMNPAVLFCVIYVITILINGVVLAVFSGAHHISIGHLLDNAILCAAPVVALIFFRRVPLLQYFNDDDCSPWVSVPVHYIISCALLMLVGFVLTIVRSEPAALIDYLSLIAVYTQGYVIVVLVAIVSEFAKIGNLNSSLRKIQYMQKMKNGGISNE